MELTTTEMNNGTHQQSVTDNADYLIIQKGVVVSNSQPSYRFAHGHKAVSIYGKVDFIADYKSLRLLTASDDGVIKVLKSYCSSQDPVRDVHKLTELVGSFILLIEQDGHVKFIYSSGEIDVPFYYGYSSREIIVHTSWIELLKRLDRVEVSHADLLDFLQYNSVQNHRTLFENLWRFKPYALYSVRSDRISLITHSFPGFHSVETNRPPEYKIDDYIRVVSCYKDLYGSFSLAYSGGTDSHMLASLYAEKTSELLTLYYKEPFSDFRTMRERIAAQKGAEKLNKKYKEIPMSFSCVDQLNSYYRHHVSCNPFSAHLTPVKSYSLAEQSETEAILSGQNADGIWGLGLHQITLSRKGSRSTSSSCFVDDFMMLFGSSHSLKTRIRKLVVKYLSRFAMIQSFERMRLKRFVGLRRQYGPEFNSIRIFPYKMFHLHQYINYCTTAPSTSWISSAKYRSKRAILPYSSPLVLHVSSHIKRNDYFDLKAPLRHLYSEFDSNLISDQDSYQPDRRPLYESPLFYSLQNCASGKELLDLRSKLGLDVKKDPLEDYWIPEFHLYHLSNILSEQIEGTDILKRGIVNSIPSENRSVI